MNIRDVAKESNVSTATVSRVLNNKGYVNSATKEIVLDVIRKLNYQPNELARNLSFNKTKVIGLILPDITNHFFSMIARGVEDQAHFSDYQVMLCNTDANMITEYNYLQTLIRNKVSGIVIAGTVRGKQDNEQFNNVLTCNQIPIVMIDRKVNDDRIDTVRFDNFLGGKMMTKHLLGLGHRKIVFLNGPNCLDVSMDRELGYREALIEAGMNVDEENIRYGEFTYESGNKMVSQLIEKNNLPSAIFAANDLIAIGAINQLREAGLKVPEDVAVVGFDNIWITSNIDPPLTTVVQPAFNMGVHGIKLLLNRIENPSIEIVEKVFEPVLEIRKSCGAKRSF